MSLTDREWDDLKALLDKAVSKFLGFSEPSLVTAALKCIDNGYDERKTIGILLLMLALFFIICSIMFVMPDFTFEIPFLLTCYKGILNLHL